MFGQTQQSAHYCSCVDDIQKQARKTYQSLTSGVSVLKRFFRTLRQNFNKGFDALKEFPFDKIKKSLLPKISVLLTLG